MVRDIVDQKVIVLNGLARGGTNIAWNILQSHPNIVSPIYKTNQIIGRRSILAPFYLFLSYGKNLSWLRSKRMPTDTEISIANIGLRRKQSVKLLRVMLMISSREN